MSKLKIGILDDHQAILNGLNFYLSSEGFDILIQATNLDEFINLIAKENNLDLLIMDVIIPNSSGISSFTKVKSLFPELPIIAYTSLSNETLVAMLIKCGVNGYVSKNDDFLSLSSAINEVLAGKRFFPDEYKIFLKRFENENIQIIKLTEREIEILNYISKGLTTQEIANLSFISANTVDFHRKSLFSKFDVKNIASLIEKAIRSGYLK